MGSGDFQTRVLVVDDEPVILETMTAILEGEGFAVRTAADGFAGLVTLRHTRTSSFPTSACPTCRGSSFSPSFGADSQTSRPSRSAASTLWQGCRPAYWPMLFYRKAATPNSTCSPRYGNSSEKHRFDRMPRSATRHRFGFRDATLNMSW